MYVNVVDIRRCAGRWPPDPDAGDRDGGARATIVAPRPARSLCRRVDRQILTITAVIGQASGIAAPDSARERTAGPRAPSSRASHIRQEARRIPGWRGCDHHLHLCGSCGASAAASCALRSLLSTFSLEGPPAYFMKYGRARLVGRGVQPPSVRPVGCSHD